MAKMPNGGRRRFFRFPKKHETQERRCRAVGRSKNRGEQLFGGYNLPPSPPWVTNLPKSAGAIVQLALPGSYGPAMHCYTR